MTIKKDEPFQKKVRIYYGVFRDASDTLPLVREPLFLDITACAFEPYATAVPATFVLERRTDKTYRWLDLKGHYRFDVANCDIDSLLLVKNDNKDPLDSSSGEGVAEIYTDT